MSKCSACLLAPALYECSGCAQKFYCSVACQKEDWTTNYHDRTCGAAENYIYPEGFVGAVKAVWKASLRFFSTTKKSGGWLGQNEKKDLGVRDFKTLLDRAPESWKNSLSTEAFSVTETSGYKRTTAVQFIIFVPTTSFIDKFSRPEDILAFLESHVALNTLQLPSDLDAGRKLKVLVPTDKNVFTYRGPIVSPVSRENLEEELKTRDIAQTEPIPFISVNPSSWAQMKSKSFSWTWTGVTAFFAMKRGEQGFYVRYAKERAGYKEQRIIGPVIFLANALVYRIDAPLEHGGSHSVKKSTLIPLQ